MLGERDIIELVNIKTMEHIHYFNISFLITSFLKLDMPLLFAVGTSTGVYHIKISDKDEIEKLDKVYLLGQYVNSVI